MYRLFVLFVLAMVSVLTSQAEYRKVSTFTDTYRTHEVGVIVNNDGSWFALVDFDSSTDNQISLAYSDSQLEDLQKFFKDLKAKYIEWVNVARENNVAKITKRVPLESPTAVALWSDGNETYATTDTVVFSPLFSNKDDSGRNYYVFNAISIKDKDNGSVTNTVHLSFENAMQLQSIINALNPSRIRDAARQAPSSSSSVEDLFK